MYNSYEVRAEFGAQTRYLPPSYVEADDATGTLGLSGDDDPEVDGDLWWSGMYDGDRVYSEDCEDLDEVFHQKSRTFIARHRRDPRTKEVKPCYRKVVFLSPVAKRKLEQGL